MPREIVSGEIPPRSGTAFTLAKGERLRVIDPRGRTGRRPPRLRPRRSRRGHLLGANARLCQPDLPHHRRPDLFEPLERAPAHRRRHGRRHDFLLTPCSADTFRIIYGDEAPHRGCFGNLAAALEPYGIGPDRIPVAFNVFMNVVVDGGTGALRVEAPLSRAGDSVDLRSRDRSRHRAHRLLGAAIEQLRVQADPL